MGIQAARLQIGYYEKLADMFRESQNIHKALAAMGRVTAGLRAVDAPEGALRVGSQGPNKLYTRARKVYLDRKGYKVVGGYLYLKSEGEGSEWLL